MEFCIGSGAVTLVTNRAGISVKYIHIDNKDDSFSSSGKVDHFCSV